MKILLKLAFYFGVLAVLLLAMSVIGIAYLNKKISEPLKVKAESKIFEIQLGDSAKEVATNLQEAGIIANKNYFLFYLWQSGNSVKLQAGKYSISSSQNIKTIADKIINGDTIKEEIQITLPEGFRLIEIESRLMENGLIKRDDLINFNYDSSGPVWDKNYDFLYKDCKGRWCILEGYLFPDTYNFSTNVLPLNVDEVVIKFLDNFDRKTKNLRNEAKEKGVDFNDIVIMASILEKEVRTPEDMKMVSGLLWKRISIGMPLQVDATIAYLTGKKTGEITYGDLKIDSPYNTYLHKGLPPGPISNPGIVALEAALNPSDNNYLYYLSKPTGETVFSETLDEHNKAKSLYLK